MEKPRTYHEGAEAERRAFKAYLKRLVERGAADNLLSQIKTWVQGRCDRYRKRKGGL